MPESTPLPMVQAWGSGILLVSAILFSVLSAMLERSGPVRLRHWAEEADGRLLALYEAPVRFEIFRLVLSFCAKLSPVALVLVLGELLAAERVSLPYVVAFLGVVAVSGVFELVNRLLVGRNPERALRSLTPVYRGVLALASPLVLVLAPLVPAGSLQRQEEDGDEEDVSEEEIEAFIALGTREGILEPGEEDMVWGIVDFGDTQVRSVMTPRIDMICAPLAATLEELAERFLDSGHSRIPLYEESIDRIVGILHIRDVLRGLRATERPEVATLTKEPYFVPESKTLDELLREMQEARQQLAIVVDEYGGTAGLVTIEDLLEEIVGEIVDEHEAEPVAPEALPDGSWRLDGRMHIEELEELFDVEVEEVPYETIGGLIFSVLGYVPRPGEMVEWSGLRLAVESVGERRIQSVLVEKLPQASSEPGEARA